MDQPDESQTGNSNTPALKVKLDSGIEFSKRQQGGHTSYVAHHRPMGKFFRLGVEEYHIATLLDGTRTSQQVHQQLLEDGLNWSPQDVAKFIGQLVSNRLAAAPSASPSSDTSNGPLQGKPALAETVYRRLPLALSLVVSQRIPLADGAAVAAKADRWIGPWFSAAGMWIWAALVLSGLCVVYGNFAEFAGELRRLFDNGLWPLLILVWCLAKVLHEIGHAVCARRRGVNVGRMGIMFFLLAPLAYVDVTDAWKLKHRFQRVQIALAGVYVELAIAAMAAWAWWILPTGLLKHLAAQVFVVAGPATLLVNANPLLRLDGYYVLSDLLEIPNLRMHGRRQLGGIIESVLLSIPPQPSLLAGWRRPAATVHAFCSVIFQFFWMAGLIIAASFWMQGLGIILSVAALLLWGLLPLSRWTAKVWQMDPPKHFGLNSKRISLIGYATLVVLTIHHFSVTSSPLARRVPVVVRYQDEQIARASADAFVTAVYAARGQRVAKGMLLMELRQPELEVQRHVLADDLDLAQQRAVQFHRQGRIAEAAAEREKEASLRRQLAELDEQLAGLRIVAHRDGLVTTAGTERLIGTYVKAGDELIRVSDPKEKELLVTVTQGDSEAFQRAVGEINSVRLRGGTQICAITTPLRPRARQSLPHPALSATVGGPLAVEPASDQEEQSMQLVEPQMESVTPLDPVTSAGVRAGQVGTMTIEDDRSLVARLWDTLWPANR